MSILSLEQIETPALLVDLALLDANIQKMAAYFSKGKAKLRPHFKTHKCPAIAHMQIAAGAKGITCAKLGEAEVLAASGINDILIANQIVDPIKIDRLMGLANNTRITVCVDNAENVDALSRAAAAYDATIYVLIELEVGMERCGVDTKEEALALAERIRGAKGLVFEGIQAYAGQLSHEVDHEVRVRGIECAEAKVLAVQTYLEANGLQVKEISGAGTGTYNISGTHAIWTEIQAGSYVFMDSDYDRLTLGFENSLSVLTTVIHKRPGFAITDAGLKVCCQEKGVPVIKAHPSLSVMYLSEEHGKISDESDELRYLQRLEYIPSHCCSTVNLHEHYYGVRNGLLEVVWPVSARGKSR